MITSFHIRLIVRRLNEIGAVTDEQYQGLLVELGCTEDTRYYWIALTINKHVFEHLNTRTMDVGADGEKIGRLIFENCLRRLARVKRNQVDLVHPNEALLELIQDFSQILPLDANLLIPPDCSKENRQISAIDFDVYQKIWLHLLLYTFPHHVATRGLLFLFP